MMPVKGLKRHFDKESGQMIEGTVKPLLNLPSFAHTIIVADVEYIFADDERQQNPAAFKFLQMAHMWKKNQGDKPGSLPGFAAASSKPKDDSDESESEDESDASSENND